MLADMARIDRIHLSRMTGGDSALAAEVLELFLGEIAGWTLRLDADAAPRDWSDAAHAVKGAALGIGAGALAALCEEAETAGRTAALKDDAVNGLLARVIAELRGVAGEARALVQEFSDTGASAFVVSHASNS